MKKYLMTGIAALAIGAAFVSCSHEVEQLSQEELQQIEIQKIKANYEQAFIKTFGQPASNQDWGFGASSTRTRGEYANANLWYKDYVVPANVTANEKKLVEDYFTDHLFENQYRINNVDFKDFFIYQVSKGTQTYVAHNNGAAFVGSDKMNHLQTYVGGTMEEFDAVAGNSSWLNSVEEVKGNLKREHMNNFNAGDNQNKVYWDGYSDADHQVIGAMLMVNSGTADFSYNNSEDSKYHNTYVIIPGETIHPSLKGFWYVGFDYFANGQNSNQQVDRDWRFNDWIVRISPAQKKSDANLRIIAEDLSAGEVDDDFDFNDVVIDVYYGDAGKAKAKILAAGGTLQLRVDGKEVHDEFSRANNNIDCAGKMINTNGTNSADANVRSKSLDGLTAPEITLTKEVKTFAQARDNIAIEVYKEVNGKYEWIALEAVIGKVASKVRVGTDYQWKDERQYIGDEFKAFVAGTASADEWYQNQNQ